MSTADCTAAIAGFASGDPTRFRRLPTTCTLADVAASLHSLDTQTRGTLANRSEPMDVRWFSSPNIPQIHAWLDASGHVVLLDAAMPPGTTDAYLKAFGQPEQKLDYRWRSDTLPGAELLWLTMTHALEAPDSELHECAFKPRNHDGNTEARTPVVDPDQRACPGRQRRAPRQLEAGHRAAKPSRDGGVVHSCEPRHAARNDAGAHVIVCPPCFGTEQPKTKKASHLCETFLVPGGDVGDRTPDL